MNVVRLVVCTSLIGVGCSANSHPEITSSHAEPHELVHDFGVVLLPPGVNTSRELSHKFQIHNPSHVERRAIRVIGSSCNCTVATTLSQDVAPDGSCEVDVRTNTGTSIRAIQEHVEVTVGQSRIRLVMKAQVLPQLTISVQPNSPLSISRGESGKFVATILAYQEANRPISPVELSAIGPNVTVQSFVEPNEAAQYEGYRATSQKADIIVSTGSTIPPSGQNQHFTATLIAQHGEVKCAREISWIRTAAIRTDPTHIFFHLVNKCSECVQDFQVSSDIPFHLTAIDAPFGVNAEFSKEEQLKIHRIRLKIDEKAFAGRFATLCLDVSTDHAELPKLKIPLYCLKSTSP